MENKYTLTITIKGILIDKAGSFTECKDVKQLASLLAAEKFDNVIVRYNKE